MVPAVTLFQTLSRNKSLHLAFLNWFSYCLITINLRVNAQGRYIPTFFSAIALGVFGFFLFRKMIEARTWREAVGFGIGGGFGDVTGIWLTKTFFHQ